MEKLKRVVIIYSRYEFKEKTFSKRERHTKRLEVIKDYLEFEFENLEITVTDTLKTAIRVLNDNTGYILGVITEGQSQFLDNITQEGWYVNVGPSQLTPALAKELILTS